MRPIEYRGFRTDRKGWVYGSLQHFDNGECYIKSTDSNKRFGAGVLIFPETVGQFTGLTDWEDTKVFEHDKIRDLITGAEYIVRFGYNIDAAYTGWYVEPCNFDGRLGRLNSDYASDGETTNKHIQVIGNIHETKGGNNG
jgi:uncharacterized phage protein (TIGR01671 family)